MAQSTKKNLLDKPEKPAQEHPENEMGTGIYSIILGILIILVVWLWPLPAEGDTAISFAGIRLPWVSLFCIGIGLEYILMDLYRRRISEGKGRENFSYHKPQQNLTPRHFCKPSGTPGGNKLEATRAEEAYPNYNTYKKAPVPEVPGEKASLGRTSEKGSTRKPFDSKE
jgi:hypothetical protein